MDILCIVEHLRMAKVNLQVSTENYELEFKHIQPLYIQIDNRRNE